MEVVSAGQIGQIHALYPCCTRCNLNFTTSENGFDVCLSFSVFYRGLSTQSICILTTKVPILSNGIQDGLQDTGRKSVTGSVLGNDSSNPSQYSAYIRWFVESLEPARYIGKHTPSTNGI
jgi:hypothetical protein